VDSLDIGHVPPPDPANYWEFDIGKELVVARGPRVTLTLHEVRAGQVFVEMVFRDQLVADWLNLDRPCVALRDPGGTPSLTLTLRKVEGSKAWLQISADLRHHGV
jgi:hypothetical protein